MALEYERNLRGRDLSRQILHLNGHQDTPRFIFFQPMWFFMILSTALSGLVPIVKYVALVGLLGLLLELSLWTWYFVTTRKLSAYPGLMAWLSVRSRRLFMRYGRGAGILSKPR